MLHLSYSVFKTEMFLKLMEKSAEREREREGGGGGGGGGAIQIK